MMKTWHIHIRGQVQGVGFRPFVFLLAKSNRLNGWVHNSIDGLHIEINAESTVATRFLDDLILNAPQMARITSHQIFQTIAQAYPDFVILQSQDEGETNLLLTPDIAMCTDCRNELSLPGDRRQTYPFITCTNCGPRYSLIKQLPYDRINTTMREFTMCRNCGNEYADFLDRRYYSQTNSCATCGVRMILSDHQNQIVATETEKIVQHIVQYWNEGKIVALKGVGGYLLTCDANNLEAIRLLRQRKYRPAKPLAVMFPSLIYLKQLMDLHQDEIVELESVVSPIVLVNLNQSCDHSIALSDIAPGLNRIGAMLPYAPIYEVLLANFAKPIVATSGNISNTPIVFDDQVARVELATITDFILTNNREIIVPQDDSVIQYSFFKRNRIILRRSRGLAPTYINPELTLPDKCILSTGAMLKSTFSLLDQGNTFISQYLGDLENFDSQETYRHTVNHFLTLFKAEPELILCDQHPEYPSTRYALQLADQWNIPVVTIQHHLAHFGAILGEYNLLHSDQPVLGVIWDGTGLGEDGQIWGGEFFIYDHYDFTRRYHFEYFDFILGDKMPREPRISALSACWDIIGSIDVLQAKFDQVEWELYSRMLDQVSPLQTSSVGRIFDAVASLLGLGDLQTYEGEAAMRLETLASEYFKFHDLTFSESYFIEGAHYYCIPTKTLMTNILIDLKKGKTRSFIAAKFHYSLVQLIRIVARNLNVSQLAFSGGVFQNALLVDLIIHYLDDEFHLYFHRDLSPNDENVSFGQLICYQIQLHRDLFIQKKSMDYVFGDSR